MTTPTPPQRILIVRLDHTGDCVLTVPSVAAAIRDVAPSTEIDVLTSVANCKLLEGCEPISKRIAWNSPWAVPPAGTRVTPKWQYFTRAIRFLLTILPRLVARYDHVLFLSFSPWERLMLRLVSTSRIGFDGPYRAPRNIRSMRWLTNRVVFREDEHLVANCYRIAAEAGFNVQSDSVQPSRLTIADSSQGAAKQRLSRLAGGSDRWIGIQPGSPVSFKSWPAEHFRELALQLAAQPGHHVFMIASQAELDQAGHIYKDLPKTVSLISSSSLAEFAALARCMNVMVTNDGGPAHIVGAIGVPLVILFGPTDENLYRPLGDNVHVLRNDQEQAAPCQTPWQKNTTCCADRACLRGISVACVLNKVNKVSSGDLRK